MCHGLVDRGHHRVQLRPQALQGGVQLIRLGVDGRHLVLARVLVQLRLQALQGDVQLIRLGLDGRHLVLARVLVHVGVSAVDQVRVALDLTLDLPDLRIMVRQRLDGELAQLLSGAAGLNQRGHAEMGVVLIEGFVRSLRTAFIDVNVEAGTTTRAALQGLGILVRFWHAYLAARTLGHVLRSFRHGGLRARKEAQGEVGVIGSETELRYHAEMVVKAE